MGPLVRQYIQTLAARHQASIIGSPMKVPVRFAALANGIFIHADDYDDTQLSVAPDRIYGLLTHPTVTVLPPAFALAEANRYSGRELTLAYHVGVEVECKIAEAISPRHYGEGFHTTGTIGSFGSAAACAKLMRLDANATANALARCRRPAACETIRIDDEAVSRGTCGGERRRRRGFRIDRLDGFERNSRSEGMVSSVPREAGSIPMRL